MVDREVRTRIKRLAVVVVCQVFLTCRAGGARGALLPGAAIRVFALAETEPDSGDNEIFG